MENVDDKSNTVVSLAEVRKLKEAKEAEKPSRQLQLDLIVEDLANTLRTQNCALGFAGGDDWWVYKDGYWRPMIQSDKTDIECLLEKLSANVKLVFAEKHATVWKRLQTADQFRFRPMDLDQQPLVAVRNGTLDIETGEIVDDSPENMISRYVDIHWDADATCPMWESILNDMLDDRDPVIRKQIIDLLQEWFGMALAGGASVRTPRALRKALFLYGPKWAGKSTVIETLRNLIGNAEIAASRVGDIKNQFGLEKLTTAKAWITEEADDLKISDAGRIKCLITGEPISAPRKNKLDATLMFNGPIVWAANTRPVFNESSDALYSRMLVLALERTFTIKEAEAKFGKDVKPAEWLKQHGELPGIFAWALRGYDRLLERGHYEDIADMQAAGESWREQNDAVYAFLKECCITDATVTNTATTLGWAAFSFARGTRNEFIKLQKLKADIRGVVASVFPSVKVERQRRDTGRLTVYHGLALNKLGLSYLKKAQSDSEAAASETTHANEKILG